MPISRSAHYLDGRVTAVLGTHTHVQTADAQVLPGGSAYMTDAGMTINQWALTTPGQYIAYVVNGAGLVERIAIGYRGEDGSITLPPPC